ncbi:MAG: acyl carrier protein [Muribaculaceae bacterium]|nr:acyl carrier protein [Muribaculaceae bacterium]
MTIEDFIANFADQFEETEASVFSPDTEFKTLDEWGSLIALSLIAMVDEEYDVTLKGDDIRKSNTIQDLFNIVTEKM